MRPLPIQAKSMIVNAKQVLDRLALRRGSRCCGAGAPVAARRRDLDVHCQGWTDHHPHGTPTMDGAGIVAGVNPNLLRWLDPVTRA